MVISIVLLVIGFFLLIKGANWMVDGASALAKKFKISDLAIGLTIVAFGTSAPELVVNSFASINGHSDIVFGNIIGSNNFNLFAILGIVGLISPIAVQSSTVWKEIPISLFAALFVFFLCHNFFAEDTLQLGRIDGFLLLICFGLFLFYVYQQMKKDIAPESNDAPLFSTKKIWLLIGVGLAGLVIGGKLVVDAAVEIATQIGVSEKVIGLTIVAAGTSLPELVTSVVAALKKNADIAIGNVIGSNIFNLLLILSISSFVSPIAYSAKFDTDFYVLIGGTIFLFAAMFTGKKKKLDRWEAAVLLLAFHFYTFYLLSGDAA